MVDVGVGGQAHVQQRPGHCCDMLPIRRMLPLGMCHGAVHVAQPGGAQAHGLDGAAGLTGVDDVADPYWSSISMKVPEMKSLTRLCAEAEGNPGDAGAGDQQAEGDAQLAQDHDAGDDPHDDGGCRPQQVDRGWWPGRPTSATRGRGTAARRGVAPQTLDPLLCLGVGDPLREPADRAVEEAVGHPGRPRSARCGRASPLGRRRHGPSPRCRWTRAPAGRSTSGRRRRRRRPVRASAAAPWPQRYRGSSVRVVNCPPGPRLKPERRHSRFLAWGMHHAP